MAKVLLGMLWQIARRSRPVTVGMVSSAAAQAAMLTTTTPDRASSAPS
ncbi:hypothetical protein [Nocardia neocaledoniensis]|nr:hypothetical protein [Nocardia neocaledoniensis]